jgi:hypothetical protein
MGRMKARLLATSPFFAVAITVLTLIAPRLPAPACHQDRGTWLCDISPSKADTHAASLPVGRQAVLEKEKERGPDGVGHKSRVVLANSHFGRHVNESRRGMGAARLATMRHGERTGESEPSAALRKVDQVAAAGALQDSTHSAQSGKTVREYGILKLIQAAEQGRINVEPAARAAQAARLLADQQDKIAAMAEASYAGKSGLGPPPYSYPLPSYSTERERLDPWHGYDSRDGPGNGY